MSESTLAMAEDQRAMPREAVVAIQAEDVSKVYSQRWFGLKPPDQGSRYALKNVSFSIAQGEMVGLLGPNGSGKTTLLKSISTLLTVSSGRILLYGEDVAADPSNVRRSIGLVTCDERSFYWRLSGRKNLKFFAALYHVPEKKAGPRIDLLLETLGLTDAADRPYHGYSTGMRQKLAIARGLLSEPRIVLYDEPTRSLDPISAENIRQWILANRLVSPTTTHLIATNQLHEAEQLCERVLILNRGALIVEGSINEIRDRYHKRNHLNHRIEFAGFPGAKNILPDAEIGLLEVSSDVSGRGAGTLRLSTREDGHGLSWVLAEILRCGGTVIRCETEQPPFDEVFCSLILGDRPAGARSAQ